jgi:PST family polysaccharide transporter
LAPQKRRFQPIIARLKHTSCPKKRASSLTSAVDRFFSENKAHAGLGRQSVHSGIVLVVARAVNMIVQVGSTILLARMLSAEDYGLVAMVFALLAFAPMLIDLGTTDAFVQKTRVTRADVSTLFFINLAIGASLAFVFVGVSPLIAAFYSEPALTSIALASSLIFIVTALSTQHYALMRRAMEFHRLAMIETVSNVASSIIAIVMAFTGWGYWALVAKPILALGFGAIGVWASCPWFPERPRMTPAVKEMLRFGLGVTGFTMTDSVARSADRVALGYFYGAGPLGFYQNALLLYENILGLLTAPLHNVAVSSLSKLRNQVEALKRSWSAALSSVAFVSCLGFAGLAVVGDDFTVLLLGQKWEPAGPLLCIFAIRGIAHVAERSLGWLHVAAGRSDRWMRWGFFSALFQLAALLAGVPFGLIGVATAHAIATFCLFVPALVYAGQPFGIGARDVLRAVGPQIVAALITVAIGHTAQHLLLADYSGLARLAISVCICLAVYLAVAVGLFRVTGPIELGLSVMRDLSRKRLGARL